jgi:hypothetical protein
MVSIEQRGGCSISRLGVSLPIRLLKSPATTVINCGCARLIRSSNYYIIVSCDILRFCNDWYGGKYIFIILIRVLLGSNSLVNMPYSLFCVVSIFSGFRIKVATPPRVLFARLDSITVKPSRVRGAAPSAIHVSCRHTMSKSSYSNISNNFK